MGDDTSIEWTDATWNPVRGCSRVSPGCEKDAGVLVEALEEMGRCAGPMCTDPDDRSKPLANCGHITCIGQRALAAYRTSKPTPTAALPACECPFPRTKCPDCAYYCHACVRASGRFFVAPAPTGEAPPAGLLSNDDLAAMRSVVAGLPVGWIGDCFRDLLRHIDALCPTTAPGPPTAATCNGSGLVATIDCVEHHPYSAPCPGCPACATEADLPSRPTREAPASDVRSCIDCRGVTVPWAGEPGKHLSLEDMKSRPPCCHDEAAGWFWCRFTRNMLGRDRVYREQRVAPAVIAAAPPPPTPPGKGDR